MAPVNSVFMPVSTALTQLIQSLQSQGSRITDFSIGSGIRDIFEAVAVVASNLTATADQLQLDSHLDTATGSALDALALDNWQVARLPAIQATGQLTITRQRTAGAMVLPAGFTQLVAAPAVPGDTGVSVLTTQDAIFADGAATAVVTARAVIGGNAGNLTSGTFLTPMATVNGISSQDGYEVTTTFANGVDEESDDRYRARIPIVVQGRNAKGTRLAFLAGVLSIPGVLSGGVIPAGGSRGDASTVPAGSVEVFYQGNAGLLSAVQSGGGGAPPPRDRQPERHRLRRCQPERPPRPAATRRQPDRLLPRGNGPHRRRPAGLRRPPGVRERGWARRHRVPLAGRRGRPERPWGALGGDAVHRVLPVRLQYRR